MAAPGGLAEAAVAVLAAAEPPDKLRLTEAAAAAWQDGRITKVGRADPPARPARPARPLLVPPREVPRRRIGRDPAGRIALLHALAHIELNAIDLAWDLIARFGSGEGGSELPRAFFDDWCRVAADEARHFGLLSARLGELGAAYGDLPAHDGLWEAARATSGDLLARLAVVPLVLEARGLDVTPGMIDKLRRAGDPASAAILEVIYREEITHVAAGERWFAFLCRGQGASPGPTWEILVRRHFKGLLKPPFNDEARRAAGMSPDVYGYFTGFGS
ncbi:MAG: ferritin-like domain-containing protein [Kiloniellales bacterium]|nr:ferritin-like domain-containing protein [Kiloniellales bacterium]